jgi:hypothetical protein
LEARASVYTTFFQKLFLPLSIPRSQMWPSLKVVLMSPRGRNANKTPSIMEGVLF